MFEFFEHEDTGTFTHHETVAALAEGTAGALGVVVAGREGVHGIEATESAGRYGSFCTTGDDGVRLAEANEVESVSDGVGRRRAGRSGGIVGTWNPYMIEICPEAMSAIILGMKKGLNRGPFSS